MSFKVVVPSTESVPVAVMLAPAMSPLVEIEPVACTSVIVKVAEDSSK